MSHKINTAILYYKKDAIQFLKDNPIAKAIYPITPDAKAFILNKTQLPLIDPLQNFSDYDHRRVVASVRSIERKIHPLIEQDNILSLAGNETLISLLHVSLSSCFYLYLLAQ